MNQILTSWVGEANAKFIVRAVNNHEPLRSALGKSVELNATLVEMLRHVAPQLVLNCAPAAAEWAVRFDELAKRLEADIAERRKLLEAAQ